eukprot:6173810-Pleurochrysis_carterae.AAC.1
MVRRTWRCAGRGDAHDAHPRGQEERSLSGAPCPRDLLITRGPCAEPVRSICRPERLAREQKTSEAAGQGWVGHSGGQSRSG